MSKMLPNKPLLILLYGYPGSGKTHFARQLCEHMHAAHVQGDRIRNELFEKPRYDKAENEIVEHLMEYMTGEFLSAGVSVVFDTNAMRMVQRRMLRDLARKMRAEPLLIWIQIDADSAYTRISKRDRRRSDDKYAKVLDRTGFDQIINAMQNPRDEEYIVISGKHTFNTQRSAVTKRLYELNLVTSDNVAAQVVKPGLVNLIPNPMGGRVDTSRRNIIIR